MQHVMVARPGVSAKIALTIAVALGGVAVVSASSEIEAHYKMVDALVTEGLEVWRDVPLKVHGWVMDGSIVHAALRHTFVLAKGGKHLRVVVHGSLPDTVKDGAELVVAGRLVAPAPLQPLTIASCAALPADADEPWVLEASEVFTRCATHYEGIRGGEPAPHFE